MSNLHQSDIITVQLFLISPPTCTQQLTLENDMAEKSTMQKKQITFKVPGPVGEEIYQVAKDEGWGSVSEFVASVMTDFLKNREIRQNQKDYTLESLRTPEVQQAIHDIVDKRLWERSLRGGEKPPTDR